MKRNSQEGEGNLGSLPGVIEGVSPSDYQKPHWAGWVGTTTPWLEVPN